MWLLQGELNATTIRESGSWDALAQRTVELAEQHFNTQGIAEARRLAAQNAPDRWFALALAKDRWLALVTEEVMASIDHESREHATLSASGCDRWWNCPGSINLNELLGTTSTTSVYAAMGTAAHELAHMCMLGQQDAIEYIDREVGGFTVDLDMAETVQIYLDTCRKFQREGAECFTEKRFSLKSLKPPKPMFGTADFVALDRKTRRLTVVDFKYGKGVTVAIENNPQLKYYGLGAMLAFPNENFDRVDTMIAQPRVSGPPIKSASYDAIDILGWSVELIERAKATLDPNAPLNPGSWCRFCPASGRCKAQAEKAFNIAQIEFSDVVDPVRMMEKEPVKQPPEITKLTPAQMSAMLSQADILEDFVGSLRAAAQQLIEHGETIPGWKVVPKRATRFWRDEDAAPFALEISGVPTDALWTKKLISPKQAEVQLTKLYRAKGAKAGEAEEKAKHDLKDLIDAKSSGGTLAPEADTRPTLPGRGTEFDFEKLPALASE